MDKATLLGAITKVEGEPGLVYDDLGTELDPAGESLELFAMPSGRLPAEPTNADIHILGSDSDFAGLTSISIDGQNVTDLSPLAALPHLQGLELYGLREATNYGSIKGFGSLDRLKFGSCHGMKDLHDIQDIPELKILRIYTVPDLTSLAGIGKFPKIEYLQIMFSPNLIDISALAAARSLRSIMIHDTPRLETVAAFSALPNLRFLNYGSARETSAMKKKILGEIQSLKRDNPQCHIIT